MDALTAIYTKIEVREFSKDPVPFEDQLKVIEAGRQSASGYNRQPWKFVLINDRDLLVKVGALAPTGPYIAKAAFAVAVFIDKSNPLATIDGTRAAQNMMIAGWALGLGSVWVNGLEREKIAELLGAPNGYYLHVIIPFGKPAKKYKGKKNRKPLSEVAYLNTFKTPLSAKP